MSQAPTTSRLLLERYLAGELVGEELARVEAALASDPATRAALEALREDELKFRAEVPYAAFRVEHEQRKEARRPARRWALWAPAFAVLAGAAGMLLVSVQGPTDDGTRAKGGEVALSASVQEGGAVRAVTSGERVAPGARVQLGYEAGTYSHVALLGIDAAGAVSVYFSDGGERLAPLPAGPMGSFPFSLTLDDALGEEQFVAVFSTRALPVQGLLSAAQALTQLPARARPLLRLPSGAAQATLWVEKK